MGLVTPTVEIYDNHKRKNDNKKEKNDKKKKKCKCNCKYSEPFFTQPSPHQRIWQISSVHQAGHVRGPEDIVDVSVLRTGKPALGGHPTSTSVVDLSTKS